MTHLLATQATGGTSGSPDLLPLLVVIGVGIALLVVVGLLVAALRRSLFGQRSEAVSEGATLMEDLRSMRDRGEISEDEYKSIRATMVERAKAAVDASTRDAR